MKLFRNLLLSFFILLVTITIVLAEDNVNIYRLYNSETGEHLYTSSENEARELATSHGWTDEGIGWVAPSQGDNVYRLYNPAAGDHLYTTDQNEVSTLTTVGGWEADNGGNPLFTSKGDVPVYRLCNLTSGRHHLTTDENEYNVLGSQGWRQEGVAIYAVSNGRPNSQPSTPSQSEKLIIKLSPTGSWFSTSSDFAGKEFEVTTLVMDSENRGHYEEVASGVVNSNSELIINPLPEGSYMISGVSGTEKNAMGMLQIGSDLANKGGSTTCEMYDSPT